MSMTPAPETPNQAPPQWAVEEAHKFRLQNVIFSQLIPVAMLEGQIARLIARVRSEAFEEAMNAAWHAIRSGSEGMDHAEECALMGDLAESAIEALKEKDPEVRG